MNNTGYGNHEQISPKLLRVDMSYQRELDVRRVNKILKEFDPQRWNCPKVSLREDGYYYIFDGQHSAVVYQRKNGNETPVPCQVYYGLTPDDEARLFWEQNINVKKPTSLVMLRAKFNHNDPSVLEMVDCVGKNNIKIDFASTYPADDKIAAIEAAYNVYMSIGKAAFINMLSVIKKAWLGSAESLQAGMLKGFGYIFKHCYESIANISLTEIAKSFEGYPVSKIAERANSMREGSMEKRWAIALAEQYNKRKKSRRIILPQK